ncbi:MAG: hypothetical protein ABIG20_03420 [archaeon]
MQKIMLMGVLVVLVIFISVCVSSDVVEIRIPKSSTNLEDYCTVDTDCKIQGGTCGSRSCVHVDKPDSSRELDYNCPSTSLRSYPALLYYDPPIYCACEDSECTSNIDTEYICNQYCKLFGNDSYKGTKELKSYWDKLECSEEIECDAI